MKKKNDIFIFLSKLFSELRKGCKFKNCLFPDKSKCSNKIIQAHSIQKNKILNRIADNGLVISYIALKSLCTDSFEEVGIKSASTFYGFCNYHDTVLFSPIENYDYAQKSEQNFLHAYRACAREYAMKYETFHLNKKLIKKLPHLYDYLIEVLRAEHQASLDLVAILDQFHSEMQKPEKTRDFKNISTHISKFPYESLIAVNSMFYIMYDFEGNLINDLSDTSITPSPSFLSIYPQNGETFVLLSCFTDDLNKFQKFFSKISNLDQKGLENFYSNLIMIHCENFFLSPNKWNNQPPEKRKDFINQFQETMFIQYKNEYLSRIPPINLFEICK